MHTRPQLILVILLFGILSAGPLRGSVTNGTVVIPIIDIHTHIFNARDLPMRGILERHHIPPGIARIAAKLMVGITPDEKLTAQAIPFVSSDGQFAIAQFEGRARTVPRPPPNLTEAERKELLAYAGVPDDSEPAARDEFGMRERRAFLFGKTLTPEEQAVIKVLGDANIPPPESFRGEDEVALATAGPSGPSGPFAFFNIMTRGSLQIPTQLRDAEYPMVDLFIHHMMDLGRTYADKTAVAFEDQVKRMNTIDRRFDDSIVRGQFLHTVAWDPYRGRDALSVVTQAVKDGAIGVKFYPPSGYRSTGNKIVCPPKNGGFLRKTPERRRWDSRYGSLDDAKLDALNRSLFGWCVSNDIPIFTHCTPFGFEGESGYGWNSNPAHWAQTLKEFPTLRLCFGHAGGEEFWCISPTPDDTPEVVAARGFGSNVVELCLSYPNVYAEVAYLDPVLKSDGAAVFQAQLASVIDRSSTNGSWSFGDKLMYGSDWHMMHIVRDHREYPAALLTVFAQPPLSSYARRFFAGNAVKYLRLNALTNDSRFSENLRRKLEWIISESRGEP